MDDLMMTAAAAQIPRPAAAAGFLMVHVTIGEPAILHLAVDAGDHIAESRTVVADEAMTRVERAFRRDAEVAGAGAARIGAMRALVDLAER